VIVHLHIHTVYRRLIGGTHRILSHNHINIFWNFSSFPHLYSTGTFSLILTNSLQLSNRYRIYVYFYVKLSTNTSGLNSPGGPKPTHHGCFSITHKYITFGMTPLEEWSGHRKDIYKTTHTTLTRDTQPCHVGSRIHSCNKRAATYPLLVPQATGICIPSLTTAYSCSLNNSFDEICSVCHCYNNCRPCRFTWYCVVEDTVLKRVKLSFIVNVLLFFVSRSRLVMFIIHTHPSCNVFCKRMLWTYDKLPLSTLKLKLSQWSLHTWIYVDQILYVAPQIPCRDQLMKSKNSEKYEVSCTEIKNCWNQVCFSFKHNW
jgi:hypothetical protein